MYICIYVYIISLTGLYLCSTVKLWKIFWDFFWEKKPYVRDLGFFLGKKTLRKRSGKFLCKYRPYVRDLGNFYVNKNPYVRDPGNFYVNTNPYVRDLGNFYVNKYL